MRTPVFGVAVITPLILAGAVGASAPSPNAPASGAAVTPLAAVEPSQRDGSGASVVAVTKTPTALHIATANVSAPPPAVVVNSPGTLRIPAMALTAYRNAERMMAAAYPGCGVSWNLLAGIGRIESMHANGGATDARGTAVRPIYGPKLDGSLPGNEIIVQSRTADRVTYARAMGPMQFLPGTWSRYASDGDGDGKAEVQNLFDSTLAAARYLCSGGLNLRDQSHVMAAILRYNNSMAYARNVLGWAGAYATGVVPGGPAADHRTGAGDRRRAPGALGRPRTGPAAERHRAARQRPAGTDSTWSTGPPTPARSRPTCPVSSPARCWDACPAPPAPQAPPAQPPPWLPPWMQPPQPACAVFCLGENTPAPVHRRRSAAGAPPGRRPHPARHRDRRATADPAGAPPRPPRRRHCSAAAATVPAGPAAPPLFPPAPPPPPCPPPRCRPPPPPLRSAAAARTAAGAAAGPAAGPARLTEPPRPRSRRPVESAYTRR